jgi:putative ABC transport system permease protein
VRFGESAEDRDINVNGFVVRGENLEGIQVDDTLQVIPTQTFIENMPGYSEQSLTLSFMIYFLFIISAVILAIFLYVLTIQKISIFGVMKAQGISSSYLAKSVIAQTFLLALAGTIIGFILTITTGYFLPLPFQSPLTILICLSMEPSWYSYRCLEPCSRFRPIVKIDPLEAIGG